MAGEIDVELGRRLRTLRTNRSVSQERLGNHLGISFQQIQKYEAGSNRISVATLLCICRFLSIEPGNFLDGLTGDAKQNLRFAQNHPDPVTEALGRIKNAKVRKLIERLTFALSEDATPPAISAATIDTSSE